MTNVLKSKIAKAGLGLLAGASMLVGASSALALTAADISSLQAAGIISASQAASLMAGMSSAPTGSCYNFTANLTVGTTSPDVKALQQVLNKDSRTALNVAAGGNGSMGNETSYYGPATKAAVVKYQSLHMISPTSGNVYNLTRGELNKCVSTGPVTTTPGGTTTGPVSAMLSSDNTPSGYIIAGQATADLAHFTFTGSGTVTSVTLTRGGISDQNTLSNVYLYQGNTRLTDGYSFNNTGVLTMNGLNIAVNGSTTISVKADVASAAGSTLNVALTGFTANGTAMTANVKGNDMYLGTGTLATVYIDPATQTVGESSGVVCTSSCPTVNAGTSAYTVWSDNIQVNTRTVWLKGANFRIVGSAPTNALANVRLFVDGVATGNVATMTTISGSNYAMFDFSGAPVSLTTGSHTVDVRADINAGASYTVQVSLQQAADLVLYDGQVNVNIAATKNGTPGVGFSAVNAGTITINAGSASVVVDPTFSAMTNVTGGSTNVNIAKFKVHGYGEDVKVQSLSVTPNIINGTAGSCTTSSTGAPTGTCGLNNVAVFFNGSQVGSSVSWTSGSGAISFNLGSQMILPAGADSTIEVKADLQTTGSVNYTAGTVNATLNVIGSNAQGQTSHTTLSFPGSVVVGTTLAIQNGLLGVAKNAGYTNQVVNPNTAGVKIGSFTLQNQSSSESVHVTGFGVTLAFAAPTYTSGTVTTGSQAITVSSSAGFTVGNVITIPGATPAVGTVTAVTDATHIQVNITSGGVTPTAGGAITGSGATSLNSLTNLSNLRTSETSGSAANPVLPTVSNNFSPDFVLAPGATKVVDVLADTSTANMGTVVASLTVTSIGVNSHVSIAQNNTGTAVAGQTITFGAGTLGTPTVVTSTTTQSQFVAGGTSTGTTDATKATFNITASNGTATISELRFKNTGTSGSVTAVRVGTTTAYVGAGDTFYLPGVNLVVPNGGAGLNVDAFASYAPVGASGVTSGGTAVLQLCSVKYTIGGTTTTSGDATCASPLVSSGQTMTLVGSKPTVTVAQPTGVVLTTGAVEAIDVTIAADSNGPITVNSFDLTSTLSAGAGTPLFTAGAITVKDAANNPVSVTTATACTSAATCAATIQFGSGSTPAGYLLSAGQSQTFKIFLPVAALGTGTLPNTYMNTRLVTGGTSFNWTDTAGSASSAQTTTANIYNYPSTFTSSIHN